MKTDRNDLAALEKAGRILSRSSRAKRAWLRPHRHAAGLGGALMALLAAPALSLAAVVSRMEA